MPLFGYTYPSRIKLHSLRTSTELIEYMHNKLNSKLSFLCFFSILLKIMIHTTMRNESWTRYQEDKSEFYLIKNIYLVLLVRKVIIPGKKWLI